MLELSLGNTRLPLVQKALTSCGLVRGRVTAHRLINGRTVAIEWSHAAAAALERRARPLIVELELYFSCLVKKSVHFHEAAPGLETIEVTDKLQIGFRAVTATACSMDEAERLGRQPAMELNNPIVRRLAPSRVWLDHRRAAWVGEYWI